MTNSHVHQMFQNILRDIVSSITQTAIENGIDDPEYWEIHNQFVQSMEEDLRAMETKTDIV